MSRDLRNTLIAVFVFAVLASGAAYLASTTKDERDRMVLENAALEDEVAAMKVKVAEGPELKRQLEALTQSFGEYVKILPTAPLATEEKLIKIVQTYSEVSLVQLQEVVVNKPKPGIGNGVDFEEITIVFRLQGSFEQMVRFMNLFEQHEPFLKITAFTFSPGSVSVADGKEIVPIGLSVEASTYTYIPKKSL